MCKYVYVCMYVCMYIICVYVCMYIHLMSRNLHTLPCRRYWRGGGGPGGGGGGRGGGGGVGRERENKEKRFSEAEGKYSSRYFCRNSRQWGLMQCLWQSISDRGEFFFFWGGRGFLLLFWFVRFLGTVVSEVSWSVCGKVSVIEVMFFCWGVFVAILCYFYWYFCRGSC